jgi:hypothetical protein
MCGKITLTRRWDFHTNNEENNFEGIDIITAITR